MATRASRPDGRCLLLNEDNSHFFSSRSKEEMTIEGLHRLIDHYVDQTQVKQLLLSPNSMCASFASEVLDPIWHDCADPDEAEKAGVLRWPANALRLHQRGIDPYAEWLSYSKERGISAWLSMRMNDVHNVDDPTSFMHSSFWKENPQFRRETERFDAWNDRAFDYGHPEVRDYHMTFIRELFERYDFDGLELDWMRFGYHFRPGTEAEGAPLLTAFMSEVRQLADDHARRRGHRIEIGVRVPSRPWTAAGLGLDAIRWAREGFIDLLVVTPFWATLETEMPIEKWKELLGDHPVVLAAGLEVLIRPYPAASAGFTNNAETVRGAAASLLHRGADAIYLFNYMDSHTTPSSSEDYDRILQEAGSLETITNHLRRHVVTYSDTWAPDETPTYALPVELRPAEPVSFAIHLGQKPTTGTAAVFIGMDAAASAFVADLEVRVNGQPCSSSQQSAPEHLHPVVECAAGFDVPNAAITAGHNMVEVSSGGPMSGQIMWVEIRITP